MINQSPDLINALHYKITGLWYLKTLNASHIFCYNDILSIMSVNCRVCFTIKAEEHFLEYC